MVRTLANVLDTLSSIPVRCRCDGRCLFLTLLRLLAMLLLGI